MLTRSIGRPETGQPVRFEMTEQTRKAIDSDIAAANKNRGEFLFGGSRSLDRPITARQQARLVGQSVAGIGLDLRPFGTHSLWRTKKRPSSTAPVAALRAVQLLGHKEDSEHGGLSRY